MTKPNVFRVDGSPVGLGERIGRGGEGEVYALANDNSQAVKIYSGSGGGARRDKISAMVSAKLSDRTPLATFPKDIVQKRNGEFAGFIMRRINGHRPLFELYAPGARKSNFPQANYPFLVLTASNFARAVGAVHAAGCVIGDINHSGILISKDAKVSLIDADSFQLVQNGRRYLCRVGVPDYTPPELQGKKLDSVVREANHDNFGLAIVLFQLLFMGRHPFSGSYQHGEMPIEKAIAEHRFAYGTHRNVGMKPPPAAPLLKHFPPALGAAFEAAFGPGGVRPEPRQWMHLLADLNRELRTCRAEPLHHHWQGAPECPWCRMERLQGISLFLPAQVSAGAATLTGVPGGSFNAEVAWRAIEAVSSPGACNVAPRLQGVQPNPSADAARLRGELWKQRLTGAGAAVVAGVTLIAAPAWWIVWVPVGWFGLAKMFGGADGVTSLERRRSDLDKCWQKALADWRSRCGEDAFQKLRADLHNAKTEYQGLAAEQSRRVSKYQQNRRQVQLDAFLDTFYIRKAKISGIGPSKTATLASYGIETAADITGTRRIEQVPGFGPTTAFTLLAWRRRIESRFVYNPNPNPADQVAMATIKAEIAKKELQLRQQLALGPQTLRGEVARAQGLRQTPDAALQKVHTELAQADADLAYIKGKVGMAGWGWFAAIVLGILAIMAIGNADWSSTDTSLPPMNVEPVPTPAIKVAAPAATDGTPVPDEVTSTEIALSETSYAVRETNVRAKPSTTTAVIGKLERGTAVSGVLVAGLSGQKPWVKVTAGPYKGYYVSAAANLTKEPRPPLSTETGGPMVTTTTTSAFREPSWSAPVLAELGEGTRLDVVGTTSNGFAEVSLRSGAIGYVEVASLAEPGAAVTDPPSPEVSGPVETAPEPLPMPGAVAPPSQPVEDPLAPDRDD